jgi:AIPR protein
LRQGISKAQYLSGVANNALQLIKGENDMTSKTEKSGLFDFMLKRIKDTGNKFGLEEPQAFGRWFLNMYFREPQDVFVSDGSKDGKVDIFFTTHNGSTVQYHVMNTKYTGEYNRGAPVAFYQEITYFWHAFENKESRESYLATAVKLELRPKYRQLFEAYDAGRANLIFVTNHRLNEAHYGQVAELPVEVFHLDDLIQYLIDDLDGAMPRTAPLTFNGIHNVPSPYEEGADVHTSIVFARLVDFIKYMQADPYDLLFMRNVRVAISVGKSLVNRAIRDTFRDNPKDFAYSNNGITLLCEKHTYTGGNHELVLENPRVVNGSQTLHSIRDVRNPSADARVMVRIVEIPPPKGDDLPAQIRRRKDVISQIAVRSNQQNPIKKWDLVSNDDFQLELYRYFRQMGLFYERRDREWSQRSRELRSVGIQKGPGIKHLTQLIASYYWSKKSLGPANAKSTLGELFEGDAYNHIRQTAPELTYQLFLLSDLLDASCSELAYSIKYVSYLNRRIDLALFALATKALQQAGAKWGTVELTELLRGHWDDWPTIRRPLRDFTKTCIDHIYKIYKKDAAKLYRTEGYKPTYINYFKNQTYVSGILNVSVSHLIRKSAKPLLIPE